MNQANIAEESGDRVLSEELRVKARKVESAAATARRNGIERRSVWEAAQGPISAPVAGPSGLTQEERDEVPQLTNAQEAQTRRIVNQFATEMQTKSDARIMAEAGIKAIKAAPPVVQHAAAKALSKIPEVVPSAETVKFQNALDDLAQIAADDRRRQLYAEEDRNYGRHRPTSEEQLANQRAAEQIAAQLQREREEEHLVLRRLGTARDRTQAEARAEEKARKALSSRSMYGPQIEAALAKQAAEKDSVEEARVREYDSPRRPSNQDAFNRALAYSVVVPGSSTRQNNRQAPISHVVNDDREARMARKMVNYAVDRAATEMAVTAANKYIDPAALLSQRSRLKPLAPRIATEEDIVPSRLSDQDAFARALAYSVVVPGSSTRQSNRQAPISQVVNDDREARMARKIVNYAVDRAATEMAVTAANKYIDPAALLSQRSRLKPPAPRIAKEEDINDFGVDLDLYDRIMRRNDDTERLLQETTGRNTAFQRALQAKFANTRQEEDVEEGVDAFLDDVIKDAASGSGLVGGVLRRLRGMGFFDGFDSLSYNIHGTPIDNKKDLADAKAAYAARGGTFDGRTDFRVLMDAMKTIKKPTGGAMGGSVVLSGVPSPITGSGKYTLHAVTFPDKDWKSSSSLRWLRSNGIKPIKKADRQGSLFRYRIVDPKGFNDYYTSELMSRGRKINLVYGSP
jgi:hypothetical protein